MRRTLEIIALKFSKKSFYHMSLFTLYGFGILAWIIVEWGHGEPFIFLFFEGDVWYRQLIYGLGYGLLTGLLAIGLVRLPFMRKTQMVFTGLIRRLDLTSNDILFFSFCAAVGEELLFRAALQPLIGIWTTSILFVALHGYLTPFNWRLSVYGAYMVFVVAGIGFLYAHSGILAAIASHFIIDVVLFEMLRREAAVGRQH